MMRISRCTRLLPVFLAGLIPLISGAVLAKPPAKAAASKSAKPADIIHMYRYTDSNGVVVTGNSISPEYARKGYQIVTPSGEVLETVAREPTPEERAQYEQKEKDKLVAAKQAERDKELLLRYSDLEDIKLAKDRKLTEINNKISMLNSNIATLNQQIDFQQQSAASYERDGQAVPIPVLSKIEALHQEMKISEKQLADRKKEFQEEDARFSQETERFIYLESKRSPH